MRLIVPLILLAAAGCASGSSGTAGSAGGSAAVTRSVGVAGTSERLNISAGSGPNVNTLAFAADRVWRILPAAFDSIGVPVNEVHAATRSIGNSGFKIRQRLGKSPLSRYIDCGQTQIGPNADSYEVFIVLLVQANTEGTGTKLVTNFEASARPLTFSQGYSRCTSRGTLEARLLDAIRAQLQ